MGEESTEPKAEPLRVPVSDVPVRNSILAPEPEPNFSPMAMREEGESSEPPERNSVVSQPVRYVSDHPSRPPTAEASAETSLENGKGTHRDSEPLELSDEAVADLAVEGSEAPQPEEARTQAAESPVPEAPEASAGPAIESTEEMEVSFDDDDDEDTVVRREPGAVEAIHAAAEAAGPSGPPPAEALSEARGEPQAHEEPSSEEPPPRSRVRRFETIDLEPGELEAMMMESAEAKGQPRPSTRKASMTMDLDPSEVEAADDEDLGPSAPDDSDIVPTPAGVAQAAAANPSPEAPRASIAQPPPPPERVSQAQPPPPPAADEHEFDIDVAEDESPAEVVIDLSEDSDRPAAAKSPGGGLPPPAPASMPAPANSAPPVPPTGRESLVTPPPPPPRRGMSGGAVHRVADLKPSKPRKHHWWEVFFDDDYLRSVRMPSRDAVARKADFIEQRLGLARGATVLDVGCGWGVDVVELSSRGYLGVGMDLSLAMLSRAADEAQDRGQRINFLHADMREMNFDGTFDAVMCLGTTFGYFDDEMNRQVIERLHRALKPQGVLLLEIVNRDHVIRSQPNLVWFEGDGCVCMEESEFNYFTSRLYVKRTVILDDGKQRENEYSLRLYSLHELGQMLHQQGFRVTEVSGRIAIPGVFFGQESPELLIVAERRAETTGKHSLAPDSE